MVGRKADAGSNPYYKRSIKMKREEAIKIINQTFDKREVIITSTGLMSRELFNIQDSPRNFYMTGSMGLASSLGMGIAINKLNRKIVVVEGDASLLMNLGSLTTIGHFKPKNLIHIVLDNNSYDSCSSEPSISKTAQLDNIAKVVGYSAVEKVVNKKGLENALKRAVKQNNGPVFILTKIHLGGRRDLPRPVQLGKITKLFKNFLLR